MSSPLMNLAGEQIRGARKWLGMSQLEFARQTNVSVETIKRLEATEGYVSTNILTIAKIIDFVENKGLEFTDDEEYIGIRVKL